MDKEKRRKLIDIYQRCSDEDLKQFILDGEESFEEGVYELILAEVQKRGIYDESDEEVDKDEVSEEIDFHEMSSEDLLGILVNIHTLDELNFHLAYAEAIRRNIDMTDIKAFKALVRGEQNEDDIKIEMIENPRPLIILKTIDEASVYTDTLDEEGISFEIQIIVDDKDYKKAEMATNNILPPTESE